MVCFVSNGFTLEGSMKFNNTILLIIGIILISCSGTITNEKETKGKKIHKKQTHLVFYDALIPSKKRTINITPPGKTLEKLNSSDPMVRIEGIQESSMKKGRVVVLKVVSLLLDSDKKVMVEAMNRVESLGKLVIPYLKENFDLLSKRGLPKLNKISSIIAGLVSPTKNLNKNPHLTMKIELSGGVFPGMPILHKGLIYSHQGNTLFAIDPHRSNLLWKHQAKIPFKSSPLKFTDNKIAMVEETKGGVRHLIFLNQFNGKVLSVSPINNSLLFKVDTTSGLFLISKNEKTAEKKEFFVVSGKNGKTIWSDSGKICGVSNDIVIIKGKTNLHARKVDSGKPVWSYKSSVTSCLISGEGIVISDKKGVSLLNQKSGEKIWYSSSNGKTLKVELMGTRLMRWTLQKQTLLTVYNLKTGKTLWKQNYNKLPSRTIYKDEHLLMQFDGNLLLINGNSGKLVWKLENLNISKSYINKKHIYLVSPMDVTSINHLNGKKEWIHKIKGIRTMRFEGKYSYLLAKQTIQTVLLSSGKLHGEFRWNGKLPLYCGSHSRGQIFCGSSNYLLGIKLVDYASENRSIIKSNPLQKQ
jgi:outer membrane protein assembly factor BamB